MQRPLKDRPAGTAAARLMTAGAAVLAACAGPGATAAPSPTPRALAGPDDATAAKLRAALAAPHRSDAHRARDAHRHPFETLTFFGLRDDQTVVELWPGGGWYTEILAPVLRDRGQLITVDPVGSDYPGPKRPAPFSADLATRPELFDRVLAVTIEAPRHFVFASAGSVDLVLAIRYLHGWVGAGIERPVLAECFRVLKPGGVLGVVAHRGPPGADAKKTGYMGEEDVIRMVEAAGFKLAARSEINANPKDTKDHPHGVWSLPPTLRADDADKPRLRAIGETDRMTLKFVKP